MVQHLKPAQVCRIFGLSHRTVAKLFDRGILTGFRLPGSKWRRFHPASVAKLAQQLGIDWPPAADQPAAEPLAAAAGPPDAAPGSAQDQ